MYLQIRISSTVTSHSYLLSVKVCTFRSLWVNVRQKKSFDDLLHEVVLFLQNFFFFSSFFFCTLGPSAPTCVSFLRWLKGAVPVSLQPLTSKRPDPFPVMSRLVVCPESLLCVLPSSFFSRPPSLSVLWVLSSHITL